MFDHLINEIAAWPEVEAIALGGSRAGVHYDEKSDYDVYLYCTAPINVEKRRETLEKYCRYMEIGNHFWEYEDNCTLKNDIDIDILYRDLDDFTAGLSDVVQQGNPHNGYTTCMWHNLRTCKILTDKSGRLTAVKQRFDVPYPAQLKENIIRRNNKLLEGTLPAYEMQIRKAISAAIWSASTTEYPLSWNPISISFLLSMNRPIPAKSGWPAFAKKPAAFSPRILKRIWKASFLICSPIPKRQWTICSASSAK